MAYGRSTHAFKLRSPFLGDSLNPDEEARTHQIIDNQLYGLIRAHSGGNGILRDGSLSVLDAGDGTYTVLSVAVPSQGKPVMEAFINQIYVYTDEALRWTGLINGNTYYLYVRLVESDSTTSSLLNKQVVTSSNTTGSIPSDGILVAAVILDEPGNSVVINDPNGRVNLPVLGDHIADSQNPHGSTLYQTDLVVSGLSILDYLRYRSLQVDELTISGNSIISGNITVLGQLIISGNVVVQGNITYSQLQVSNLVVPDTLTVGTLEVVSGMDVYPQSTFRNHINFTSGVTIDGFDPSVGVSLINGSNADHLHTHTLGSLAASVKPISFSPEYANTVLSGTWNTSGSFLARRLHNRNYYEWFTNATKGEAAYVVTRFNLPDDFESIDRLTVNHGVGTILSGGNVSMSILDKDNTAARLTGGWLQSTTITESNITASGANFLPQYPVTVIARMDGASGIQTLLGDMTLWYVPRHGEKVVFTWNQNGDASAIANHFDGLRVAPTTLRIEKLLASQEIALSGASFFDLNVANAGSEPTTFMNGETKPVIAFGAIGASYQTASAVPVTNTIITGGQIISAGVDQIASGSRNVCLQLITRRL